MSARTSGVNAHILEEATHWFIEVNEPGFDDEGRRRFNVWLRRSPEHVQAYLQIAALWEGTPAVAGACAVPAAELVARTLGQGNVVAFPDTPPIETPTITATPPPASEQREGNAISAETGADRASPQRSASPQRRRRAWAIAASLLVLAISLAGWQRFSRGVYATDFGERRSITLSDGSSIELNARSQVRVRFTGTQRRLELLAGQALFRVAKDPSRPFVVDSNGFEVRAVGTQFDVYRKAGATTTVTVVEGRVAISIPENPALPGVVRGASPDSRERSGEIFVGAGEQVVVSGARAARPARADLESVTAWTRNQIIFRETPLGEVIEEFNRYNERQLIVDDPRIRAIRINGSFSSADPQVLLRFLRDLGQFEIDDSGADIHIRGR